MAADPARVEAWLRGRSIARGLPKPVPVHGGWRVDTGLPDERCRYVFASVTDGLRDLAQEIAEPYILLKLVAPPSELRALVPPHWQVSRTGRMMHCTLPPRDAPLPSGFRCETITERGRTEALIRAPNGEGAASGYSAEASGVFIYDRIRTEEPYRRIGLGRALMGALGAARRAPDSLQILTATDMGRSLYRRLGWTDVADYSTGLIPG